MDAESERVTRVRDAILLWLLKKKRRDGNPMPVVKVDDIETTVDWQDEPIHDHELTDATSYLLERGLISGPEGMGAERPPPDAHGGR